MPVTDFSHKPIHTCVCATGVVPLFSCERKKRMDMNNSWMQTLNSSSFWPPVASEKSRRDWMMYLKMYSLAWEERGKKEKRICLLPPDGKKHKSSFQGKLSDNREFVHFVLMNFIQSLIILFISKSKVPDYSSNSDNEFIILSFWVKHEEINWNKTNKSLWHCDLKGHLRLSSTHRC